MKRLLKRSGIMRILILTCATGGGHLRAAAALEKYIRETTTHEVIQMDFLKSIGKLLDKTICDSYLFMAKKTPSLFGRLYKRQIKIIPLRISSPAQRSFWRSSSIRV